MNVPLIDKSVTSKYHDLYWKLVKSMKKSGVQIIHRELKSSYGLTYWTENKITIESGVAGTLTGLIIALHERSHLLHQKNGKFSGFYKSKKFTRENHAKLIWRAEWDCFNYAKNTLKRWGIDANHKLLDKKWVKNNLLEIWIKYYCNE